MSTKDLVLKALEENRDRYVSGQFLADSLSLSRTAIWKAIGLLRDEGYAIDSVTNKGYRLDPNNDILTSQGIYPYLDDDIKDIDIFCYDTIDSTNTEAKRLLYSKRLKNFSILISDEQTGGRGRFGRKFFSPKGSGIYISFVIFPKDNDVNFDLITIKAATAVANSIKMRAKKNTKIKWVNDIYIDNKKVSGILTEADFDFESMEVKSIIVGIGINFYNENLDDDIKDIATAINCKNLLRNEFIGTLINEFHKTCYEYKDEEILNMYKNLSLVLNKDIEFKKQDKILKAHVIDINDKGNLVVKYDDDSIDTLSSGEISLVKESLFK